MLWNMCGRVAVDRVCDASDAQRSFRFLYPLDSPITSKIEAIATKIYGAKDVTYSPLAQQQIERYKRMGFDKLPICMAKTHLSLSTDATKKGVPTGFTVPVREVRASVGAGFLYPILGTMRYVSDPMRLRLGECSHSYVQHDAGVADTTGDLRHRSGPSDRAGAGAGELTGLFR
jgi:hypothetical protein